MNQLNRLILAAAAYCVATNTLAGLLVEPFTADVYRKVGATKGVVLVAVNWARKWKCGPYENAQLKSISFERSLQSKEASEAKADLTLEDPSLLGATRFTNYVYIVEPGEYSVTGYSIKVAKSISEVGHFNATRADLVKNGKSSAGSFSISAGELIYIGHFVVDCYKDPIPWRFYPSSKEDFKQYLSGMSKEFEELPIEKVQFRLLETSTMGQPFSLP